MALRPLLQANEVAVLPRGHALARHSVLAPEHFAGERFISLAVGDPYRVAIDQMFTAAGVRRINCLETASVAAVCAMVRQGLGVAIVNPLTALELSGADLLVRPLSVLITFQVSLLLPQMAAPHPLRDALAAALIDTAAEMSAHLAHRGALV